MRSPLRFSLPGFRRRRIVVAVSVAGLLAAAGAGAFFAAAAVAVPACNNGDAGGITPITGIVVLSETVAEGRGCGTQPGQIYKYTSLVTTLPDAGTPQFVAGGTNDCFVNGTFANLCASSNGSSSYDVLVYAFTETDWNAALAGSAAPYLPSTTTSYDPLAPQPSSAIGGPAVYSICTDPDGGNLPKLPVVESSLAAHATVVFACTATQQANIPVLAACVQVSGAADAGTGGGDGGDAGANSDASPLDAGADALPADGSAPDASDAAASD